MNLNQIIQRMNDGKMGIAFTSKSRTELESLQSKGWLIVMNELNIDGTYNGRMLQFMAVFQDLTPNI